MMDVVQHPSEILTSQTSRVMEFPSTETIKKMLELMQQKRGVGLAANQVGIAESFFVARFSDGETVCVNPQILRHGKEEIEKPEGCLSILDSQGGFIYKPKTRWAVIDVSYQTKDGVVNKTLKRFDARIFQHECDHLAGRLCQEVD